MMKKDVLKLFLDHNWRFAKSMPKNPHWYTLRKDWDDKEFVECVMFIRENGYKQKWFKQEYIYLNINGYKYWTMGAPINKNGKPHTILINKAKVDYKTEYDLAADSYDEVFSDEKFQNETKKLIELINPSGRTLEIGCGTGEFLGHCKISPIEYTGIDISQKMLDKLKLKHPGYRESVINTSFQDYVSLEKYDLIIGLYGVGSYMDEIEIEMLRAMPGQKFIMFYKKGYTPLSHLKCGINPKMYMDGCNLKGLRPYGNYLIWEQD